MSKVYKWLLFAFLSVNVVCANIMFVLVVHFTLAGTIDAILPGLRLMRNLVWGVDLLFCIVSGLLCRVFHISLIPPGIEEERLFNIISEGWQVILTMEFFLWNEAYSLILKLHGITLVDEIDLLAAFCCLGCVEFCGISYWCVGIEHELLFSYYVGRRRR